MFMVAAGLTLVFGVMDFINLAHGVQYMVGAYLAAVMIALTGNFAIGLVLALIGVLVCGLLLERVVFRPLYQLSHLDQVLATFGLILFLNQGVKMVFGASPLNVPVPEWFEGSVMLGDGILYPLYRFVIIAAGLLMALFLWLGVEKTRIGMQLRAGASHPDMLSALGVDVRQLFMLIFAFGSVLAGFAGALAAPILSVEPGMGDQILILAFVVIVIGGIGSIRGAFAGAILVGLLDTLARSYMVDFLRLFTGAAAARGIANGLSSMFIYILMAVVLFVRPEGLFPARGRS